MSKTAKFFIICGAVCVLGIIMTAAGYALGGVQDMKKVESSHSWFNIGPMDAQSQTIDVGEYDSIKVEGALDVAVIGPEFVSGVEEDFAEDWLMQAYREDLAGKVVVKWKAGTEMPQIKMEQGVLMIQGRTDKESFEVNLSGEDASPDVLVFCNKDKLKSIDIDAVYGDIAVCGIGCEALTISNDAGDVTIDQVACSDTTIGIKVGDIEAANVTGGRISLGVKTGDIELRNCEGDISGETETGDIDFDTVQPMSKYAMSLRADVVEVQVKDETRELEEFTSDGGPNRLTLKTGTGEIKAAFEADAFED